MMGRQLLLVRHAKSSWAYPELSDKERPLNKRGLRDAPRMSRHCRTLGLLPDSLISSPAVRARATAEWFHKEFSEEVEDLSIETDLYFGSESDWLYLINDLPEEIRLPAFFSHNPTITYFANSFIGEDFENVPTCGIVHLVSSSTTWKDLDLRNTRVNNYYFPKLID